LQANWRRRTCL